MRVIKLALLSFFFLFLLVTLISLFIPGNIRISKAMNTSASRDEVNKYIYLPFEWQTWHPALKDLPANEITGLKDGGISVKGTIIRVAERKENEIIFDIIQEKSKPVRSGMKIIQQAGSDSLTLQWYMDFKLKWYPWEKFKTLFYENIYGVQMEQGLANLKELLEDRRSSIK
jgi:hypothetical protein